MFDVVTSLGYNCEISFRLENFYGKIEAMPFSWSYVLERDNLPLVIENMDILFAGDLTLQEDHMIKCENTQIKFHPRYEILLPNGVCTEESVAAAKDELCARVKHLKEKFVQVLDSEKFILFIMKVENKGEENNLSYIKAVEATLRKKCQSSKFKLLVVMEKAAITEQIKGIETVNLKIRGVRKFAPRKHTDTLGDVRAWKKILQEATGDSGRGYYVRLNCKRIEWLNAVLKKRLHR